MFLSHGSCQTSDHLAPWPRMLLISPFFKFISWLRLTYIDNYHCTVFHIMSRDQIFLGMKLVQYMPVTLVDTILVAMAKFKFGDLSNFRIVRPREGPFVLKARTGRSSVIDVGTVQKIKEGKIKVYGPISFIKENMVQFMDGKSELYDAIIFATGYTSTANKWLEDGNETLDGNGFPKKGFPNQWKGSNGLYCAGFARRGLAGISMDAVTIADDIKREFK